LELKGLVGIVCCVASRSVGLAGRLNFGRALSNRRCAAILDLLEMRPQPVQDLLPVAVAEFLSQFVEGKMNDVVVMDFLRGDVATEFEPNGVEQVDFVGCEVGCVRSEIKDVLLPAGRVNLQG
jgi:hypothetical protein